MIKLHRLKLQKQPIQIGLEVSQVSVEFNVFITIRSATAVAFDSIYFRNQGVRLEYVSKKGKKSIAGYFSTSQEIDRRFNITQRHQKRK